MANVTYPVSSIVGGVSQMEYAVRLDSQATDQENCLLSSKYGLCKRPNTNYLTTIKTEDGNATANDIDCLMHPLHYGADSRILVGFPGESGNAATADYSASTTEKWKLFDETGATNCITHFPSSSDATKPAIAEYPKLSESPATDTKMYPKDVTFATVGDYTFINHAHVRPKMSTTTWQGYEETYTGTSPATTRTVKNDEVFAVWFKAHVMGKQEYEVTVVYEQPDGSLATTVETLKTDADDAGSNSVYGTATGVANDTKVIAELLAHQLTGVTYLEATALAAPTGWAGTGEIPDGATSVITGRLFDDTEPESQIGKLNSISAEGARDSTNIYTAFKKVKGISALPPRSWENHTVEVRDADNDGADVFYMKFVSNEETAATFLNTANYPSAENSGNGRAFGLRESFGTDNTNITSSTTKLPRDGYWEESCGVGVQTTVDSATMPHVLYRRPDGTFIMMEARGSFQINTTNDQVVFTGGSDDTILIQLDAGFSDDGGTGVVAGTDPMALIVGDTIQFSDSSVGGGETWPVEIEPNKDYYIISVTKNARAYTVKISETKGGSAIEFSDSAETIADCPVTLTTYSLDKWSDRAAGDDATNPLPDMFFRKINKIFTYQNRLGFCTDKEVYFSSSGDPFTLFRTTVRDLLDDDPFGVTPTDSRGDIIKDAIGYDQNLVVFTNEAQHIVRALDGKFSAKDVEIVQAATATCDFDPHPVTVKGSLFFTFSNTDSGGVWEMRPSGTRNNTWDTNEITNQVPGYLPAGARNLLGSSKHGMLFYMNERPATTTSVSGDTDDTSSSDYGLDQNIYVYTFTDAQEGRVQSAWTKWPLNTDRNTGHTSDEQSATGYRIVNGLVMSDRLYLITSTKTLNNGGGGAYDTEFYLEYMDLDLKTEDSIISSSIKTKFRSRAGSPSTEPVVLLDRKVSNANCSESYSSDTTITLPWKFDYHTQNSIEVVTAAGVRYKVGSGLTTTLPTASANGTVVVAGVDLTNVDYWVGFGYTMKSVFGPFAPQMGQTPVRGRNIYVRGGRMTYTMATEFDVKVTQGGTTYTDTVSADSITETTSGEMYFGIRKHMPEMAYTIENSNPFNAMFQGIMYDLNIQEVMSRA